MQYYYHSRRQRKQKKKIGPLLLLLVSLLGCFFVVRTSMQVFAKEPQASGLISPLADPLEQTISAVESFIQGGKLQEIVTADLQGEEGQYAVVIKNLKTGENYYFNEHEQFQTASLYKLWVMATIFDMKKNGKITDEEVLHANIEDLNKKFDIASESAELTEGDITLTTASAVNQMITISHNYAALLLSSRIGMSNVGNFLKANGFEESRVGQPPLSTAADIAMFYQKLYEGSLVDKDASSQMLEVLKKQQLNDRIPKLLPEETVVAHKTGELYGFKHDAGIVFSPKGDYIIVMMSDTKSPSHAAEKMAEISRHVYDYFEGK